MKLSVFFPLEPLLEYASIQLKFNMHQPQIQYTITVSTFNCLLLNSSEHNPSEQPSSGLNVCEGIGLAPRAIAVTKPAQPCKWRFYNSTRWVTGRKQFQQPKTPMTKNLHDF